MNNNSPSPIYRNGSNFESPDFNESFGAQIEILKQNDLSSYQSNNAKSRRRSTRKKKRKYNDCVFREESHQNKQKFPPYITR